MIYSRFLLTTVSTLCLMSGAVFAAPAPVDESAPITRGQLPGLIKEILLNDPTILMEVVEKMQAAEAEETLKRAKEGVKKHKAELFSDKNAPAVGPEDADVTIVEFFDYHCGYCKQALGAINKLLDTDKKLKVVFKEFPILSEDSKYASKAALAVNRIDKSKYLDFHKAMFALSGTITEEVVMREAKKIGVDTAKLKAEITNPEIERMLAANKQLGADIGARGTPAIVIGDSLYPGAIPFETMQKAIAEVRNPTKK